MIYFAEEFGFLILILFSFKNFSAISLTPSEMISKVFCQRKYLRSQNYSLAFNIKSLGMTCIPISFVGEREFIILLTPWWLRWQSICPQFGRPRFDPWVRKILWRRKWQPTPVLLPRKSMDGGASWATVYEVAESWTRLSDFTLNKIISRDKRQNCCHFFHFK